MAGESAPARDAGLALAEQMIEAHGGAALWNRLQAVQIFVALGGTGFRMKLLNVPVQGMITVERAGQYVTLDPYPSAGRRGCSRDLTFGSSLPTAASCLPRFPALAVVGRSGPAVLRRLCDVDLHLRPPRSHRPRV